MVNVLFILDCPQLSFFGGLTAYNILQRLNAARLTFPPSKVEIKALSKGLYAFLVELNFIYTPISGKHKSSITQFSNPVGCCVPHLFHNEEIAHFNLRTLHVYGSPPCQLAVLLTVDLAVPAIPPEVVHSLSDHGHCYDEGLFKATDVKEK